MVDRATVTQVVQIGVEATPGTGVPANKQLLAVSIEPAVKADVKSFRPMGSKFATVAALGKEFVQAKISGQAVYTDIVYLLSSVMAYAAPTQIIPSTGLAYRWLFTPAQSATDTIKTFTVEQGSAVRAHKFAYGILSEFGYKLTREEFTLDGLMLGQQLQDDITLTATPTAIALVPMVPSQADVFMDAASANIGNTQLLRVLSAEFKITDRFGPVWPINSSDASFAAHVELAPKPTLKLKLEADAQGMALLTTMRNGDKQFLRIKAAGADIDPSANPYLFQHDFCGTVTDVAEFSDEDGIFAVEFTFTLTYDATWGKATEFQVVNTLSGL